MEVAILGAVPVLEPLGRKGLRSGVVPGVRSVSMMTGGEWRCPSEKRLPFE